MHRLTSWIAPYDYIFHLYALGIFIGTGRFACALCEWLRKAVEFFRLGKNKAAYQPWLAFRLISLRTAKACIGVSYRGDTNLSGWDLTPFIFVSPRVGSGALHYSCHNQVFFKKNTFCLNYGITSAVVLGRNFLFVRLGRPRILHTERKREPSGDLRIGLWSALPLSDVPVLWSGASLRPSHFPRV